MATTSLRNIDSFPNSKDQYMTLADPAGTYDTAVFAQQSTVDSNYVEVAPRSAYSLTTPDLGRYSLEMQDPIYDFDPLGPTTQMSSTADSGISGNRGSAYQPEEKSPSPVPSNGGSLNPSLLPVAPPRSPPKVSPKILRAAPVSGKRTAPGKLNGSADSLDVKPRERPRSKSPDPAAPAADPFAGLNNLQAPPPTSPRTAKKMPSLESVYELSGALATAKPAPLAPEDTLGSEPAIGSTRLSRPVPAPRSEFQHSMSVNSMPAKSPHKSSSSGSLHRALPKVVADDDLEFANLRLRPSERLPSWTEAYGDNFYKLKVKAPYHPQSPGEMKINEFDELLSIDLIVENGFALVCLQSTPNVIGWVPRECVVAYKLFYPSSSTS